MSDAPAARQTPAGREFLQPAEEPEEHTRAQFERRLKEIRSGHKSWLPREFPFRNSHRSGSSSSRISPWKAISRLVAWQGYPGTVQRKVPGARQKASNSWTAATRSAVCGRISSSRLG